MRAMTSLEQAVHVYEELADWHERENQAEHRDGFLILAADAALLAKQPLEAERLRGRLLQFNPQHLLRAFSSFETARRSPAVQRIVEDWRQRYPAEAASDLLATLKGEPTPRILPPTVPSIDLDMDESPEPFKVYQVRDDEADKPPVLPSWTDAPPEPHPIPCSPRPRPMGQRQPVFIPKPYGQRLSVGGRLSTGRHVSHDDAESQSSSRWVASTLFVVVLLGAAALAITALIRPFLGP
jgi:hypothetical protein